MRESEIDTPVEPDNDKVIAFTDKKMSFPRSDTGISNQGGIL